METVLLILVVCASNVTSFYIGAKVRQKVDKGEELKAPNLNLVKAIQEHQESKEFKEQQRKYSTMLENINNYTPDGLGQKDIDD